MSVFKRITEMLRDYGRWKGVMYLNDKCSENYIPVSKAIEIVNAAAEQPWIPCSERLPNCNGCYLVWRPHFFGGEIGMPAICYFDGQNTWHDSYGVDFTRILNAKDVVAWMPLPQPYKGE